MIGEVILTTKEEANTISIVFGLISAQPIILSTGHFGIRLTKMFIGGWMVTQATHVKIQRIFGTIIKECLTVRSTTTVAVNATDRARLIHYPVL